MIVKQVDITDFYSLMYLHSKLYSYTDFNAFQLTNLLIKQLSDNYSLVIGLYKYDKLVGFILLETNIHLASIYIEPEYRYYTKYFIGKAEKIMYQNDIKEWYAEAQTEEGKRLLEKLCKKVDTNLYKKEIKWVQ